MEFDTLDNYLYIAKKTISKFGSKMYPSLVKEMLSNDEAVSEIAEAIMVADWKWDGDRKGKKTGLSKSLYSYRNQCAIWAIKTYATQRYRKQKKDQSQIKHSIENSTYIDSSDPAKIFSTKEESENLARDIKQLISAAPLTDKQKQQVMLYYYENKTLSEIGQIYNVTREAIRQNINKSINILRFYANPN